MRPREIWYAEAAVTTLRATVKAIENDFGALTDAAREDLVAALEDAAENIESTISDARRKVDA